MKIIYKLFIALIFTSICWKTFSQGIAIGEWRDHLPYNDALNVACVGNKIYCASTYGLFYYDKEDNSINRVSKITGLSDFGISNMKYNKEYGVLLITYINSNIDIIKNNSITNISDIKRKNIMGDKSIYNITFIDNFAYLSCGFGIIKLDIIKNEIKETYYIGEDGKSIKVNDITIDNINIYAATKEGIYQASLNNPSLNNYTSWTKMLGLQQGEYNAITYFNNKLITNLSSPDYCKDTLFILNDDKWEFLDTNNTYDHFNFTIANNKLYAVGRNTIFVYDTQFTMLEIIYDYFFDFADPKHVDIDNEGTLWIADNKNGLIKNSGHWQYEKICPSGPSKIYSYNMSIENSVLWVASGGVNGSWGGTFNATGTYTFKDGLWSSHSIWPGDSALDVIAVAINPNNTDQVFVGSWGFGLLEFNNGQLTNKYTEKNTNNAIKPIYRPDLPGYYWIGIGGLAFDNNNNLWITNSAVSSPLVVKKNDGTWQTFEFGSSFSSKEISSIVIDNNNYKWIIMPRGRGLAVFNDNNTLSNTSDDEIKELSTTIGNGGLPSNTVYSIAVDLDGQVWVGTDKGVAVFYTPENIFTNSDFDADQIIIEQDGQAKNLLETETVTAIAIDGANRKWFGTYNAGVFLMSEDGTEQIYNFNTENSPLFSNAISCIAIDKATGEVFFGTDRGIISFKSTATEGTEEYNDVYSYPNPVPPNYNGTIAIKGVVQNANVKITDISGTLIYETTAQGGQATWNGRNFSGEKAHSGVYLVFCTNQDGSKTFVTKILIID